MGMTMLTSIEQPDDHAGVQQDGVQPPKPFRCFLLEARSETPEQNLPRPAIRGRPDGRSDAAIRRSASRTTSDAVMPRLRTSLARSRRLAASSLACTVAFM